MKYNTIYIDSEIDGIGSRYNPRYWYWSQCSVRRDGK